MTIETFTKEQNDKIYFLLSLKEDMDYDTLENIQEQARKFNSKFDEPIFIAQIIEVIDSCQEGLSQKARLNEWTLRTLKEEQKTIIEAFEEYTNKLLDEFGITIDDLKLLNIKVPEGLSNDN